MEKKIYFTPSMEAVKITRMLMQSGSQTINRIGGNSGIGFGGGSSVEAHSNSFNGSLWEDDTEE